MLRLVLALTPTLLEEVRPLTDPPPLRFDKGKDDEGNEVEVPVFGPRATVRQIRDVVELVVPGDLAGPFLKEHPEWLQNQRVLHKDNSKEHRLRVTFSLPELPAPLTDEQLEEDRGAMQRFVDKMHELGLSDEQRLALHQAYREVREADHRSSGWQEALGKAIAKGSIG